VQPQIRYYPLYRALFHLSDAYVLNNLLVRPLFSNSITAVPVQDRKIKLSSLIQFIDRTKKQILIRAIFAPPVVPFVDVRPMQFIV